LLPTFTAYWRNPVPCFPPYPLARLGRFLLGILLLWGLTGCFVIREININFNPNHCPPSCVGATMTGKDFSGQNLRGWILVMRIWCGRILLGQI
jgi:hypothetical protein